MTKELLEYNEEEFFDQGLNKAKKFELTKKLQLTEDKSQISDTLDVAFYRNQENTVDFY